MQQVISLLTEGATFRSEIIGWGGEDPSLFIPSKPIGLTPGFKFPHYNTVLEAMADNWHLLAPPTLNNELGDVNEEYYDWYLVREI